MEDHNTLEDTPTNVNIIFCEGTLFEIGEDYIHVTSPDSNPWANFAFQRTD